MCLVCKMPEYYTRLTELPPFLLVDDLLLPELQPSCCCPSSLSVVHFINTEAAETDLTTLAAT